MNQKIIKLFILLFIAGGLLSGCRKEFLEEPKPGTSVAPTDVFASNEGVRAYFNGIYRAMRVQYGTAADVWGIASFNLYRVVKGLDVVLPSGGFAFDYEHDNREPTYRRTVFTWDYFYDFANQANNVIAGVEGSSLDQSSKNAFMAEARAIRAWCYFELVREFAHAYSENPDAPGIPIYTTPTTAETKGNPRSKVSEVYDLIIDDLEFATAHLGTERQLKDVINKNVAFGLLARVYLETADYAKAITAAQAARTGLNLNAAIYNTPFTSDIESNPEVMWGFPQSADQTIYYGTPSSFWGLQTNASDPQGYYNFFIDSNFVNTFSATDVRKGFFVRTGVTDVRKWKTRKFGRVTNFEDHIVMMRVAEMFLIEAESKARLNQPDAADVLYTLQRNRDPNAVKSGNTGQALINEILLERRKELYGEIGVSFLDIKRLGLPLVRSNGHLLRYRLNIPANSNLFTLKIPQSEIDANESLTDADQNQ
jgi:hypothetical protein